MQKIEYNESDDEGAKKKLSCKKWNECEKYEQIPLARGNRNQMPSSRIHIHTQV